MGIQCDCSCDYEDGEQNGFFERIVRSREDRVCCECGETIGRSEQHELSGAFWSNGGCWRRRTCLPCMRIRKQYCPTGWMYGQLADQIEPCIGFDYREVPDADGPDDPMFDGDVAVAQTKGKTDD